MKKFWPQPTTKLRGDVVPFTFDDVQKLRRGEKAAPELVAAYISCRAKFGQRKFSLKPKRNSRGVIWNGQPFYWSFKGYYRNGRDRTVRRPLQHLIWEHHHRRKMPRLFEIWFVDRDHHNFAVSNLECLHKSEVHKRCIALGEVRQITPEERGQIAGKHWTRHSRNATSILLQNFNRSSTSTRTSNGHTTNILAIIRERTSKEDRQHTRRLARASYNQRTAKRPRQNFDSKRSDRDRSLVAA